VDDNVAPELAQQHATDLLNLQKGEYPLDTSFGVDWLGLLQQKKINVPAVARELKDLINSIPAITGLSLSGTQSGQTLSISGAGLFRRFRASAEILIPLSVREQVGQNGAARFFWRVKD
jgi:hypothetical protein